MAQNSSPHSLCDYSAITIADKDAGIVTIHGKTFELAGPIEFNDHKVILEIALRRRQMADFMAIAGDLVARSLSERRLIGVDAAALTAKGINQLVFVSRSIPIHRLQDDFVVRLEGVLLSDVDTLLRKQESDPCIAQQDDGDATEKT